MPSQFDTTAGKANSSEKATRAEQHPVLAQLRKLAQRSPHIVHSTDSWPIGKMDPATCKEAAVLLLMGVLDEAPAHRESCPSVPADVDVLVLVRSKELRHYAGQPALRGGQIDPQDYKEAARQGLTVEQVAALREAVEETGLDTAGVDVLGQLPPIDLPVSNYRVTPVLAWWDLPTPVEAVDTGESTLVARLPVADLLNPANRLMVTVTRGKSRHKSPAFDVTGDFEPFTIWGFTGNLLSRVFEELGWEEPWDKSRTREIGT